MKRITLIIATLLVIVSCRKDDFGTTQIVIGNYDPMEVNFIDHTIAGGYKSPVNYYLDIDKDGRNDYMFSSVLSGSSAVGVHPNSTISCLHNQAELFGEVRQITTFLNIDTTNYSTDNNNLIHANIAHNYTCTQLNQTDSIVKISTVNKIIPMAKEDVLKVDHLLFYDTLVIANDSWSLYNNSYTVGDTTYTIRDNYPNNCNNFPQGITTYIGIRLNGTELGWIQLAIYDKYKINILETAIKK
jgi:hypothetical protein